MTDKIMLKNTGQENRNKEDGSRREHKHKERSRSREPDLETLPKETKKEKKERKRDRSQDEAIDTELKRKKGGEERIKSNGRSDDDYKHRHQQHRADSEEYHDRYVSEGRGKDHRDYDLEREYERDYEKHSSRHKRKN